MCTMLLLLHAYLLPYYMLLILLFTLHNSCLCTSSVTMCGSGITFVAAERAVHLLLHLDLHQIGVHVVFGQSGWDNIMIKIALNI